jgi:hypothetical protein
MNENDEKRFNELIRQYSDMIQFYHKLITEMHRINTEAMVKFAEEARSTGVKRDGKIVLPDICEARILHSFVGHITLLKAGVIIDSYGSLRTVYENILRAYTIHCFPEIAEAAWHFYLGMEDELATKHRREFGWLRHKFLIKKLYKEATSTDQSYKVFYDAISGKVHTTVKGMAGLFTIKEEDFIDSLKTGIGLAYSNILLLLELYGDTVAPERLTSLPCLLLEGHRFIPEGVPVLIPDVEECKPTLAIKKYKTTLGNLNLSL